MNFVSIELKLVEGVKIDVHLNITSRQAAAKCRGYTLGEFKLQQQSLIIALNQFQAQKNISSLKKLTEEGFKAYSYLKSGFINADKEDIFTEFEDLLKKRQAFRTVLYATVPNTVSFPFALLFPINPNKIDWEKAVINKIMPSFLGMKFHIHNSYSTRESDSERYVRYIKKPKTISNTIHAYDDKIKISVEEKIWNFFQEGEVKDVPIGNKHELIKRWFLTDSLHLIHFSSHLHFNRDTKRYHITLSNGDSFQPAELKSSGFQRKLKTRPLIFLNACNGAVYDMENQYSQNVIEELFPQYTLGFITTMFSVNHKTAVEMALKFYELFIKDKNEIFIALHDAKEHLVYLKKEYAAIGYGLWEANSFLTYERQTKNNRKINQKKTIL